MNFLHKPNRLVITGRSGTGKTEFFIRYIEACRDRYENIFIFDHEAEFAMRTGRVPYRTLEQLENFKGGVQCFDYSELYPGDLATALEFYADYTFQSAQQSEGLSLFCCDELQKILSTDVIPIDVACVIETGRRYQLDTVLITQQPNLLHNRFRNQATQVCTFNQNDENALKWLISFGFDEQTVRDLREGEFICRTQSGVEKSGNIFSGGFRATGTERDGVDDSPEEEAEETDPPENTIDNSGDSDPIDSGNP